jgi:hypothetical protein
MTGVNNLVSGEFYKSLADGIVKVIHDIYPEAKIVRENMPLYDGNGWSWMINVKPDDKVSYEFKIEDDVFVKDGQSSMPQTENRAYHKKSLTMKVDFLSADMKPFGSDYQTLIVTDIRTNVIEDIKPTDGSALIQSPEYRHMPVLDAIRNYVVATKTRADFYKSHMVVV